MFTQAQASQMYVWGCVCPQNCIFYVLWIFLSDIRSFAVALYRKCVCLFSLGMCAAAVCVCVSRAAISCLPFLCNVPGYILFESYFSNRCNFGQLLGSECSVASSQLQDSLSQVTLRVGFHMFSPFPCRFLYPPHSPPLRLCWGTVSAKFPVCE